MADAVRLDQLSLRCMVAGQLGSALAAKRGAVTPEQFVDAYVEILDELRERSIYPPKEQ